MHHGRIEVSSTNSPRPNSGERRHLHCRGFSYSITPSARPASAISLNGRLWNFRPPLRLFWLDVGRPDHLAPLLGFRGNEFLEVGWRHRHWDAAEFGKTGLDLPSARAPLIFLLNVAATSAGIWARRPRSSSSTRSRARIRPPSECPAASAGALRWSAPAQRGTSAAIRHVHEVDAGHDLEPVADKWAIDPLPPDAMLSLPGLALA